MTTLLTELSVLLLDCQATAASPAKGHLVEVGWSRFRAAHPPTTVETRLVRLPEGTTIGKRVARVTGLNDEALSAGLEPASVWASLKEAATAIRAQGPCPTVIHFARFEEAYLHWLHERVDGNSDFPLRILCTHAIVRRLLPRLPRCGLRAVAGYFGHPIGELRRSRHHVSATATVWRDAVTLLEAEHGVRTLDELDAWLASERPRTKVTRSFPMNEKAKRNLPDRPGVYRMLGATGNVLYVGKAKSLRARIASYFRPSTRHAEHILEMLSQARDLELTVTGSGLEAALEESDTIKRLAPPYNKALRARERALVFGTRDLKRFADTPDSAHRIGPLPEIDLWTAFSLMNGGDGELAPAEVLALPETLAPDVTLLRAGLALFESDLRTGSLLAHGARLWREDLDRGEEEEFELQMQFDAGAERFTPERVAARLNDVVKRGAHLVRRAHWLCLLSESTLTWEAHSLSFERGRVSRRAPHMERGFPERRRGFDVETYDRLTVLTQEIRRLVREERTVSLRVSPDVVLGRERVRTILRWI